MGRIGLTVLRHPDSHVDQLLTMLGRIGHFLHHPGFRLIG